MTDETRDELDALTKNPGWLRFKAWAEAEYGPSILARAADEPNELDALSKLRQARAIRGAMETLLSWPERELARMTQQEARYAVPGNLSRRGGL
jgi:hypothetical protein